jgi:hypothetical protein
MVEVEADILSEVINCTGYHKPATEFGERAWLAEGKDVDVIYWDEGNIVNLRTNCTKESFDPVLSIAKLPFFK